MKKFLFLSLVALAAACCGPKNEVSVDKLIANPAEYVGKEVTFTGKAVVTNLDAKRIAVFGADTTKYIMVQAVDTAKVCAKMCGKTVKITGTVMEVVVDAVIVDSIAAFEFIADKYFVAAKKVCKADCCKKDGKCAKDEKACCKKDSTATCVKDSAKVQ